MPKSPIVDIGPLRFPWPTVDPFLFCAHHLDDYPRGDGRMAPAASLMGRQMGSDFSARDGWSMYHGQSVPGFPRHPHRGFETITVVRRGLVDHSDSLGATGRLGPGDVQWMTAGRGIVHAEMFPLVRSDAPNPLELFQIWINLPASSKLVEPQFTMFWDEQMPRVDSADAAGRRTQYRVVTGKLGELEGMPAPAVSYASAAEADVVVATLSMDPRAKTTLPPAGPGIRRTLYFFEGDVLVVAGSRIQSGHRIEVDATAPVTLEAGDLPADLLLLQGRPIGEPVARYGPFVMNTEAELQEAFLAYRGTGFGGWPWASDAPVHPAEQGRFARHADGRTEKV